MHTKTKEAKGKLAPRQASHCTLLSPMDTADDTEFSTWGSPVMSVLAVDVDRLPVVVVVSSPRQLPRCGV